MSEPPRDRSEFWIRFVCAFVFFGMVLALVSVRYLIHYEPVPVMVAAVIADVLISWYAARHGDSAWEKFTEIARAAAWWT